MSPSDGVLADLRLAWAEHRRYVHLAVGLFALGCLLGVLLVDRVDLFGLIGLGDLGEAFPEDITTLVIFANNSVVLAITVLGILSFGILTVIVLVFNGVILGYVAVPAAREAGVAFVVVGVVPHAILELPAFFLGAAVAFRLLHRFVDRIRDHRARVLDPGEGRRVVLLLAAAWLAVAVAAAVEVHVTFRLIRWLF
ncbi:MAG: stage II sporulation protein M [Halobacteriales archaeon]